MAEKKNNTHTHTKKHKKLDHSEVFSFVGIDSWSQQTLLLHSYQLQKKWIRTEDVIKSTQEELGGWTYLRRL